jgi:hypothetical protein
MLLGRRRSESCISLLRCSSLEYCSSRRASPLSLHHISRSRKCISSKSWAGLVPRIVIVESNLGPLHCLGSANLPLDARDAHFLARLLVVVEPLVLGEVDACEFGGRLCSHGEELSLQPC